MMLRRIRIAGVATLLVVAVAAVVAAQKAPSPAQSARPQTFCPVMGGKIDKNIYADVAGKRIYACCPRCVNAIKAEPEKYISKILAKGETPETRLAVCAKCGDIKGTETCCSKTAAKCLKCGLNKGSVGCCKGLSALRGQAQVLLCASCGQVKGSAVCCSKSAQKCAKCSLAKGSPGCCKLGAVLGVTAEKRGAEINTEALAVLMRARVSMVILDARSGKFDDGKRIAGAKSLNATSTPAEVAAIVNSKDALVVTYCVNLQCPASAHLATRLRGLGYTNVVEYPQGIEGWISAGHTVKQKGSGTR
jgi:rhodanese-related sulfurtransferase